MNYYRGDEKEMLKYPVRLIVAGTRNWYDMDTLSDALFRLINYFKAVLNVPSDDDPFKDVLIISGAAKTGADRLAINFCNDYGIALAEFPAEWDNHPPGVAGFVRNSEMAEVGNCLLTFWDCESRGTADMIKKMRRRHPYLNVGI